MTQGKYQKKAAIINGRKIMRIQEGRIAARTKQHGARGRYRHGVCMNQPVVLVLGPCLSDGE